MIDEMSSLGLSAEIVRAFTELTTLLRQRNDLRECSETRSALPRSRAYLLCIACKSCLLFRSDRHFEPKIQSLLFHGH